jgi:hypothetical protein
MVFVLNPLMRPMRLFARAVLYNLIVGVLKAETLRIECGKEVIAQYKIKTIT